VRADPAEDANADADADANDDADAGQDRQKRAALLGIALLRDFVELVFMPDLRLTTDRSTCRSPKNVNKRGALTVNGKLLSIN